MDEELQLIDLLRQLVYVTHFTPFAKPPVLPPEKIAEMQRRGDAGESTRKLAKEFGVGKDTAHRIIARKGCYAEKTNAVSNM